MTENCALSLFIFSVYFNEFALLSCKYVNLWYTTNKTQEVFRHLYVPGRDSVFVRYKAQEDFSGPCL